MTADAEYMILIQHRVPLWKEARQLIGALNQNKLLAISYSVDSEPVTADAKYMYDTIVI